MKLEFDCPGKGGGVYAEKWSGHIPREGDDVELEGWDRLPDGGYRVHKVVWFFDDEGLNQARVVLRS